MDRLPSPLARALGRCLPSSLTQRVFALYSVTLLLFVAGGLGLFLRFQFQSQVEDTQVASVMLIEVVAQAVQDSVLIGDYDTVRKTLDKAVQGSLFASASFIDLQGGAIDAVSRAQADGKPPAWLVGWIEQQLYDVNRAVSVGGRDYGILRLRFNALIVAANLWSLSVLALGLGALSLAGGLLLIRLALARWLGGLDRVLGRVQALGTGALDAATLDARDEPTEIRRIVEMLNQTAALVREREAGRRALNDQKFALDQHAIVSITDAAGDITYANVRFCQISGYNNAELLGRNHRLIGSGRMPPGFFEDLWHTITAGGVWHGEICNRARDQALYWVSATIVPLLGEDGRPNQYIAIRTDITERKQAESVIMQAKEAAEQANRVKSDFLANMSHEIRTPMNGIIGMTELALDTELSQEQREYLSLVKSSADALLHIINSILDFSKIEAGRMGIEHIAFSLDQMLRETMKSLAVQAHQKDLELLLHVAPEVPDQLLGDPGRLRQVLLNLVGNAIKFTEAGEVALDVRLADAAGAPAALCFAVRDTGIGIAPEKFKAVFDSFSQADTSTTRKYGGTGLGLTISAQLVELMGGHISLQSEAGRGSTFQFTLRLPAAAATAADPRDARLAGMRVLAVDDHAGSRGVLLELLRGWRMAPVAVAGGADALTELARAAECGQAYALALLDARMPEMDGFELLTRMRAATPPLNTTVIMLTSEGPHSHVARCHELNLASHLMKPVSGAELHAAIMTALGEAPAGAGAPPARPRLAQRPLNLLVAEDNLVNQTLATRLLEKLGHRVTLASNGVEALRHWRGGRFDAILMDIDMPDMNGYQATGQIRQEEQASGAHIPIVAMTAHALRGAREQCLRHGMDSYLTKPIDTEALWRELALLGADGRAEATPAAPLVVDFAQARLAMDNEHALFEQIVGMFLTDAEPQMQAIRAALAQGDEGALRRGAHALHGMVGIFFAQRTMDALARLEQQTDSDELAGAVAELDTELTELQAALRAYQW